MSKHQFKLTIAFPPVTLPFETKDFTAPFSPLVDGDKDSNCVAEFRGVKIVLAESFSQVVDIIMGESDNG